MITIHKYPISIDDEVLVDMPKDARVLDVQLQHGVACLWALVDTEQPKVTRRFAIYGTGHTVREPVAILEYRGTFQLQGGALVFHVFEVCS